MKKNERGILTIEASLVLTFLIMFVLFIFSFARVYQAQSVVSHAVIQSADAIALESYLRETAFQGSVSDVLESANKVTGSTTLSEDSFESLRSADLPKLAREKFIVAIAKNQAETDEKLQKLGVKNGVDGIDFTECKIDLKNDDVIVAVSYTIEMQFAVLGYDEITVTKSAKAKTFGEILFEVSTSVNEPGWGTTNGDTKVTYGSDVTITANANYGYKFVKWSDGSTEPTRTVNVTDAQHYEAIFEKDQFGINVATEIVINSKNEDFIYRDYASIDGDGTYLYLDNVTVTAKPAENYRFVGWKYEGNDAIFTDDPTIQVTVDKTYNLIAVFAPAWKTVTVNVNNNSMGTAQVVQGEKIGTEIKVEYGSKVNISASAKSKNGLNLYRFVNWSNGKSTASHTEVITADCTFTANFDYNTCTVTFKNGDKTIATATAIRGSSINGSKAHLSTGMPGNPTVNNAQFNGWRYKNNNKIEEFTGDTKVNGNISVYAAWNCNVRFLSPNGNEIKSEVIPINSSFSQQGKSLPSVEFSEGKLFGGWKNFGADTVITGNTDVYADWVDVSITITGGATGNKTTQFSATTNPPDLSVTWSTSNSAVGTIDGNGNFTSNRNGRVVVTAKISYKGVECSDTVTVDIEESQHEVIYCMNMANTGKRYYTKSHTDLPGGSTKWGVKFGTYKNGQWRLNHHCHTAQSYAKKIVGYSNLEDTMQIEPNNQLKTGYPGYNKSGEIGYVFDNGSGNAIYFENSQVSSGPRGYYIRDIWY